MILRREPGHEYGVDHREGTFYITTNKGEGNREFRLVTAPASDPRPENWKVLIPARPRTTLRGIALFKHHGVVSGVDEGLPFLEILDLDRRRDPPREVPRARVCRLRRREPRVRHDRLPIPLPVARHPAVGLRLRHADSRVPAAEADRGARRLRSRTVRVGANLRDGQRRGEDPDRRGLPEDPRLATARPRSCSTATARMARPLP